MAEVYFGHKMDFSISSDHRLISHFQGDQGWSKYFELSKLCYQIESLSVFLNSDGLQELKKMKELEKFVYSRLDSNKLAYENSVRPPSLAIQISDLKKKLQTNSELISKYSDENSKLLLEKSNCITEINILKSQSSKLNELKELATSWEGKYNQSMLRYQDLEKKFENFQRESKLKTDSLKNQVLEKDALIHVKINTSKSDKTKFEQKLMFYQNELRSRDQMIKDFETRMKCVENNTSEKLHFETIKEFFIHKLVCNELDFTMMNDFHEFEGKRLFAKYENYFAELESKVHHFENKADKNFKLLAEEKVQYGKLYEENISLKINGKSTSNVSSVSQTDFDQKVNFYKQALKSKNDTIELLQKEVDKLKIYKPCFLQKSQTVKQETVSPKTSSTKVKGKSKISENKVKKSVKSKDLKTKQTILLKSPSSVKSSVSKSGGSLNLNNKVCTQLTRTETKALVYSTPKLFEYAPAHFKTSLLNGKYIQRRQRVFDKKSKDVHSNKHFFKQKWSRAPDFDNRNQKWTSKSKSISKNDNKQSFSKKNPTLFVTKSSSPLPAQKWVRISPKLSKSNTQDSKVCSQEKWNSYSLHLINTTYKWLSKQANQYGPNLKWVPKSVPCAGK